ncbi:MAG TPA: VWA domain-containing protein [Acidobacteriota bacterium]|nr:VWA domain-containing protein [Acidobacteriota bacterium]
MARIGKIGALVLALLAMAGAGAQDAAQPQAETVSMEVKRGDQLIIRNNRGRVEVTAGADDEIEVRYLKQVPRGQEQDLQVLLVRHRQRILLHTYNLGQPGNRVDLQVTVPADLEVTVRSISADVVLRELEGLVRVETLRGRILLDDLRAEVTRAYSKNGSVRMVSRRQPGETVQITTQGGDVECDLAAGLDLDLTASTGGQVSWDGYPSAYGKLERLMGRAKRASTLHIVSRSGEVAIRHGQEARFQQRGWSDLDNDSFERLPSVRLGPPVLHIPEEEHAERESGGKAGELQSSQGSGESAGGAATADVRPARTQDATARDATAQEEGVFRVSVERVRLNAVVRQRRSGALRPGLKSEDFRISEDGVERPLTNFMSGEEPFHLLLLLDLSGSTANYIRLLRRATRGFIDQMRPEDRIALATFSQDVRWLSTFTQQRDLLKRAVGRLRPQGPTILYEAVHQALRRMESIEGRKALVIFSDGVDDSLQGDFDSAADRTFNETFQAALESDAIVYTIFLDTEDSYGSVLDLYGGVIAEMAYREARGQLQRLARQTGGRLYRAEGAGQLAPAYEEIAEELRSLYTLAYRPAADASPGYKRIQVEVPGHPDLAVRHRRGYY